MNAWERFENLALAARAGPIPALDVVDRVLDDIRARCASPPSTLPLWALAGLSLLAASLMVAFAVESWAALVDPLAGLFQPVTWVVL